MQAPEELLAPCGWNIGSSKVYVFHEHRRGRWSRCRLQKNNCITSLFAIQESAGECGEWSVVSGG